MNQPTSQQNNSKDYIPSFTPYHMRKKRHWGRFALILVGILIVIALAGLGYKLLTKKPTAAKSPQNQNTQTASPKAATTGSNTLEQYVSNGSDLNLSFSYPSSWTVTPTSNNNTKDQTITLTSPLTTITSAAGTAVTGKVIVQIRPATATISELNTNTPTVALTSTQIAYSAPTSNQSQYPYISYIHFSNANKASGAFEEVVITGTQSFTQDQTLTADDLSGLDPVISASFYQCSTQTCSSSEQKPLSITSDTWQTGTVFKQVLALFESFKLN